ncbi:MAG: alpha/beta hydrolase [Propionibacteriaceae bacterium]|nr:alpha/beta hydrolase [Propionibacteriaceae bacterium]
MSELTAPLKERVIAARTRAEDPETAALVDGWLAGAPARGFAWAQRAMAARPDRLDALAALEVPAAVLCGTGDALMDADSQSAMAEALGVSVTMVEGPGHLLPIEAPEPVASALTEIWARAKNRTP